MVLLGCSITFLMLELGVVQGMALKAGAELGPASTAVKAGHGAAGAEETLAETKILQQGLDTKNAEPPIGYAYPASSLPHSYYGSPIYVHPPPRRYSLHGLFRHLKGLYRSLADRVERTRDWLWNFLFRQNHQPQPYFTTSAPYYHPNYQPPFHPPVGTPVETLNEVAHSSTALSKPPLISTRPELSEASTALLGTRVEMDVPKTAYVTPVEYLPGSERTDKFIEDRQGLYRAFAHIKLKDQELHEQVRQQLIEHIRNNPEQFSRYLTTNEPNRNTISIDNRLYRLSDAQLDGVELAAFADLQKSNVVLVSKTGNTVRVDKHTIDPFKREYKGISVEDGHYELLRYEDPMPPKSKQPVG
ncbi:hypothetical protein PTTG_06727 [Puccinia triticina 1-1 BBBD Race 1]|uniref:Uncharacterized protein n=2 Tax=Puccinia triticina TaxID=208348 RepID=A0A180GNY8_PUCT1|nr:uncharacterized protein PtA15_2A25 [Puccinia triticina]OAV94022.1 hypothetical protein PTTG_06727 [Puccinia triticina 1-1 BBBD Race 1]WAQ81714.1 hypothetical protein PtA15_2A25 [Puccinia triticina]WAR52602.1 hypothetical protein PtB15_2B26 [Puccinia triticina]